MADACGTIFYVLKLMGLLPLEKEKSASAQEYTDRASRGRHEPKVNPAYRHGFEPADLLPGGIVQSLC